MKGFRQIVTWLLCAASLALVAGCDETSPYATNATSATSQAPATASTPASVSATHEKTRLAFSGTGKTEHGDRVHIEGRFGPILAPADASIDQTALGNCPDTDGRELVRRLDIAVTITSGLPGDVRLSVYPVQIDELNQHDHLLLDYVLESQSEANCYRDTAEGNGAVNLGTLQPHVTQNVTMWIVLLDAITPDDPHPSARKLAHESWDIGSPAVSVDGAAATGGGVLSATEER